MNGLRKFALLAIILTGLLPMTIHADGAPDPITDPFSADNPLSLKTSEPDKILPSAFSEYAPGGNFLDRMGTNVAANPPSPSAVNTIIVGLVNASAGKTIISRGIWTFAMALVFFGVTLSGFITYKTISAGKETPGLGSVKWIGKVMMCFILVNYVASAVPRTLIAICDDISKSAGEWSSQEDIDLNAVGILGRRIVNNYGAQLQSWTREAATRIGHQYPGKDNPKRKIMVTALVTGASEAGQILGDAREEMIKRGEGNLDDAETSNVVSSDLGKIASAQAFAAIETALKAGFTQIQETDDSIQGNIMSPPTIDLSGLAYPVQIIRTTIYISVVYIAISIWSMPIAILIWAGIFSLPSQWQMNGILFGGIKTFLTVIITMTLVMVYTSGTLTAETEQLDAAEEASAWKWDFSGRLQRDLSSLYNAVIDSSDTKLLSFSNMLTGTTTDLLIASMLIFTAPAQAAAIVKGANGIAESAKQSMMAGGSAYGMKQALFGMGTASTTGQSSGLGGGSVTLGSFQGNQGPKR